VFTTGMKPEWSAHESRPRTTPVSDKALIRSSVALRAPPSGIIYSSRPAAFFETQLFWL